MTTERSQSELDPSKPFRRQYGPKCPGCGRVIAIAAEDVAPNVEIRAFREILRRRGYRVEPAHCPSKNCGHSIDAQLHLVEFGEIDDTLPAEDTF